MNFFKKYYAELTGLSVFLIYLLTVSPAVVENDCGELAAVQATLGIAHPPGYPLFTIIGFLFSKIPFPLTSIHQLNILCSIWCALSVIFFVKIVKMLIDNVDQVANKKLGGFGEKFFSHLKPGNDESDFDVIKYLIAILSGLIYAFSFIVWSQSVSVEVYSLQLFLYSLIIYFFFKAYFTAGNNETLFEDNNRMWLVVGVVLGLGLSNHMMTIYLLPALVYLYFEKFGLNENSLLRFLILTALVFVIVSIFYSYLLIRSAQEPAMNFGDPSDINGLINHVTAKYYRRFSFAGLKTMKRQITFFINSMGFYDGKILAGDFNILLILTFIGLIGSWFSLRKIFTFFALMFITCIVFTISYNIPDIYQYFSAAYLSMYFYSSLGCAFLMKLLWTKKYNYLVPIMLVVLFLLIKVDVNYGEIDKSNYYVIEDYARSILEMTDKNSVIFSKQWDYIVAPGLYLQNAEKYRTDVILVHYDLISSDWYIKELRKKYNIPFNPKTHMIDVSALLENHACYLTPEMVRDELPKGEFKMGKGEEIIPDQLLFKVVKTKDYVPAGDPNFLIRFPEEHSALVNYIEEMVGSMLVNRIRYELSYQKYERAKIYLMKLISDCPFYPVPDDIKKIFNF